MSRTFFGRSVRVFLPLLAVYAIGCSAAPVTSKIGDVEFDDLKMSLRGAISHRNAQAIEDALSQQPGIQSLTVSSPGGDALAGIRIGRLVRRRGLTVYVEHVCASACAQYVLPAGLRKVVYPGSIIAFHSSPIGMEAVLKDSDLKSAAALFADAAAEEREFYREIGIKMDFPIVVAGAMRPLCVLSKADGTARVPEDIGVAWSYSALIPTSTQLESVGFTNLTGNLSFDPRTLQSRLNAVGFGPSFRPIFAPDLDLTDVSKNSLDFSDRCSLPKQEV